MKVYLIRRRDRRHPAFYSEEAEILRHATGRPARGRLERWARTVKALVLRTRHRAGSRLSRVMDWLMRRPNPDEALLRALRGASEIELYHPESMSPRRARRLWYNYLRYRRRQQLGAASWDILMVAITAPMLITPGPGALAFWFLYRVLVHLLAMFGTIRALSRSMPLVCVSRPCLDVTVAPGEDEEIALVSAGCGIQGLATYLRRLEKRTADPIETDPDPEDREEPVVCEDVPAGHRSAGVVVTRFPTR